MIFLFKEGKRQATLTGLKAGQNIAIQINSEFGYYFGICEAYKKNKIQTNDQRVILLASQICDLVSQIDFGNSQNEQLVNELNRVRDKFKQFCSLTNLRNMLAREIPVENLTF
jgi:hypothetical protein